MSWNPVGRLHASLLVVTLVFSLNSAETIAETNRASARYVFSVSTDRPDSLYKAGETAAFKVRLIADDRPVEGARVQWTVSKDGVAPFRNGNVIVSNGCAVVSGSLAEPGFLLCNMEFETPAKKTLTASAGAGFDPTQLKPSLPVPEDFDAFWAAQKRKLSAVEVDARLTPVQSPEPGIESFDVQAECVGAPVSGYMARPLKAAPKSLPIILTVHGAGVQSSSLPGSVGWAKKGFLAMDINAHGIANGKPTEFYRSLAEGELKDYRTRGCQSRETIYFGGMFLRLQRALDVMTAQPQWDGRTLVVYGSSQGGAQAIAAAALDKRVSFFVAGVPAMCDHSGMVAGRICGWPKLVPIGPGGKPDRAALEAARYFDMVNFATRITCPGLFTVGFIDTTCPPSSVYTAYNALCGRKEMFNDPPSPHAVLPKAREAMNAAVLRHVEEQRGQR